MKLILFTALSILAFQCLSASTTKRSQLISYVQKKYANQFRKYPILIFDIDEIEYRYALKNALGEKEDKEKERLRKQILTEYVKEKTGVELTENQAANFEIYTSVLKGSALALDITEGYGPQKIFKICGVFPSSPNSNDILETERLLGLDTPGAYSEIDFYDLKKTISYENLTLFSMFHELGHCFDQKFNKKVMNTYSPSISGVHRSESFAEVFALFLMEKEGIKGLGKTRALYRNLYSLHMGQWFVDNPPKGLANPIIKQAGAIYWLVPVLLEASYFVDKKKNFVESELQVLIDKATEVVETKALDHLTVNGIYRIMKEGKKEVLDFYVENAIALPELFSEPLGALHSYLSISEKLESEFIVQGYFKQYDTLLDPIKQSDICRLENQKEISSYLNEKRTKLSNIETDYHSQKQLQKQLNSFFTELANCSL